MTKVKICGHTSVEDALTSEDLGADFIGMVVEVPVETPRNIDRGLAAEIVEAVIPYADTVMVMIPGTVEEAVYLYKAVMPDMVQLHGTETPDFLEELSARLPCPIIKTQHVGVDDKVDEVLAEARRYEPFCDYILLDTKTKGMGGSGKTHDWSISQKIVEELETPVFLAGGLNPKNVRDAVDAVGPYCIDTSSGVESQPGKKDPEKVRDIILKTKG